MYVYTVYANIHNCLCLCINTLGYTISTFIKCAAIQLEDTIS